MIKAIFKNEIKVLQYGILSDNKLSIVPCETIGYNKINIGDNVNLAVLTKDGLEPIKNQIGKVIGITDNNDIAIKFNVEFAYDNKLYVISETIPAFRTKPLTIAYVRA